MMVALKSAGPNHLTKCSESVHALKTRVRGALKTRVIVTSRSDALAVVLLVASIFFSFNLCRWMLSGSREVIGEVLETADPSALVIVARGDRLEDTLPQGQPGLIA